MAMDNIYIYLSQQNNINKTLKMEVQALDVNKTPWYLKPFFWNQKRKYGEVLIPGLVWARVPKLFMAVAALYGVLDRKSSPLSPELRSLVTVRVSQINTCEFCIDINSMTLVKRSGNENKLHELDRFRESSIFSDKEKTVLEYAEAVTYSDQNPSPDNFIQLKKYFSEDEIVELTALITFQNMSSKFNSALDISGQGFCKI